MLTALALTLLAGALYVAARTRREVGPVWYAVYTPPRLHRSTLDALREKRWSPERLRAEALTARLVFNRPDLARLYLDEADVQELAQRLTAPRYRVSCAYAVVRA